jgi:hypothetical protein
VELTTVDPAVEPGAWSVDPRATVAVMARSITILRRSTDA